MSNKKLTCEQLSDITIEGDGNRVTYVFTIWRKKRNGDPERTDVRMEAYRCGVDNLLGAIRKMHRRDRDRLKREEQRITDEVRALTEES